MTSDQDRAPSTRIRASIPELGLYCYGSSEEHCVERLQEAMRLIIDVWESKNQDVAKLLIRRVHIAKGITFEERDG